jgi:hypothetical protein
MSARLFRPLVFSAVIGVAAVSAVVAATKMHAPRTSALPQASDASPQAARPADSDNPKVEPGKVRWHASFDDAQRAAGRSGKPVLLFHLMGRLDRQFC